MYKPNSGFTRFRNRLVFCCFWLIFMPKWVVNLATWVSEDKITAGEMIVAIEHLINN
jgi:hypothetical protein